MASAAGFILDDADGLGHMADDALVVETTDHVRKIHHQFRVSPGELLDFQFLLFGQFTLRNKKNTGISNTIRICK